MEIHDSNYKLSALIIEPHLASKIRLKEALTALPRFSGAMPVPSLREASDIIKDEQNEYDLLFIAQSICKEETARFIKSAKELTATRGAAFVLLLKSSQDADMAGAMIIGFDGMLAEPYSVDSLNAICELALKVKKENGAARERAVLGLMLSDVSKQLDNVAVLKACGYETARGFEKFKESCHNFSHLSPEAVKAYEEIAEKIFGSAAPAKPPEKRYGGVSRRIKNRMASKIIPG